MKKNILSILIFTFLAPISASAESKTRLDCRAAKILNDNVFEEGLSTHEYPDVYLFQEGSNLNFSVGAMQDYDTADGAVVEVKKRGAKTVIKANYKGEKDSVVITVSNDSDVDGSGNKWANLDKIEGDERIQVALLICKKVP
ncbi:MAG: hypothetical protein SGJ18_16490 [Pseudomonadota bacterium]|nr:hypothetical protein [Pseudomonadota bacterium]